MEFKPNIEMTHDGLISWTVGTVLPLVSLNVLGFIGGVLEAATLAAVTAAISFMVSHYLTKKFNKNSEK